MGLVADGGAYVGQNRPRRKTRSRLWREILVVKKEAASAEKQKIRGRMPVVHGIFDTPFGKSLVGICEEGICHASFFRADEKSAAGEFRRSWTSAENRRDDAAAAETFGKILVPDEENPPAVFLLGTSFQLGGLGKAPRGGGRKDSFLLRTGGIRRKTESGKSGRKRGRRQSGRLPCSLSQDHRQGGRPSRLPLGYGRKESHA